MHVDETGDQIFPCAVDAQCVLRQLHVLRVADLGDQTILNYYRLVREYPLTIHWDDVDIGEGDGLSRHRCGKRRKTKNQDKEKPLH